MGWQTFQTTAQSDTALAGLPSGSAYYRFTWRELEPERGNYALDRVRSLVQEAKASGQSFMFRVMLAGAGSKLYTPDWLLESGCRLRQYKTWHAPLAHDVPDLDDPVCFALHEALIERLGEELASETELQVDIGSVGLWGEWHFSGTEPQVPMPSLATKQKVVDLYMRAFPAVPKLMAIGDLDTLKYAVLRGAGWRADCLGDLGFSSDAWNHMEDVYLQHVEQAGAESTWLTAPVAWETCYTISQWLEAGYNVHDIFQYALELHGSFLNNKSQPLPDDPAILEDIRWLIKRLGYRLVLRSFVYPRRLEALGEATFEMVWDNLGVAPCLMDYVIALRLRSTDSESKSVVLRTALQAKTLLPGASTYRATLQLPPDLPAGEYDLSLALVDANQEPRVTLAVTGRAADGWYALGPLEIF